MDYKQEVQKEVKADHYTFAELKENDEDLKKLKNWLERIKVLDFYGAPARADAERQLIECEELLDSYASEVFEREQDNKADASKAAPITGKASGPAKTNVGTKRVNTKARIKR